MSLRIALLLGTLGFVTLSPHVLAAQESTTPAASPSARTEVAWRREDDRLTLALGGQVVAEYVWRDEQVLRPYFRQMRTRAGTPVTRAHPPVVVQDPVDHATMHPGLGLAFGDLNGADFWRNRGTVRHVGFSEEPQSGAGRGSFAVENSYEADGQTVCTEDCRIAVAVQPTGYLLYWTSTFRSAVGEIAFGDQEEMGLGLRVATPLTVAHGGMIVDSEGRRNEAQVWGRQADWCEYRGTVGDRRVGVVLMPDPRNFRRPWFHARDYGLLVANPFGANAFTQGSKSRVAVTPGEEFRLGFGVFVYETPVDQPPDLNAVYRTFVQP